MARGDSGRIVIEVEPEMKRRLYSALALSGSTLKAWFVKTASEFCSDAGQMSLFTTSQLRGNHVAGVASAAPDATIAPGGQPVKP